jgi:hypothetical protein
MITARSVVKVLEIEQPFLQLCFGRFLGIGPEELRTNRMIRVKVPAIARPITFVCVTVFLTGFRMIAIVSFPALVSAACPARLSALMHGICVSQMRHSGPPDGLRLSISFDNGTKIDILSKRARFTRAISNLPYKPSGAEAPSISRSPAAKANRRRIDIVQGGWYILG